MTRGDRDLVISVQNRDLAPVPLHDKGCTAAAKGVSCCYALCMPYFHNSMTYFSKTTLTRAQC